MKVDRQMRFPGHEQFSYLLFGVLTTLINYAMFWLLTELWHGRYVLAANLLTFIVATAFAFITNKQFVFRSCSWQLRVVIHEGISFTVARLFSFCIEEAGLYVSAYMLGLDRFQLGPINGVMVSKILLSVLAVVLNYFFSKFLVFAKKKGGLDP